MNEQTMGGASLKTIKAAKRFGTTQVLQQLDLSLNGGDFIAIVGKSGCGKSTLLRLIAGLEPLTEGEIYINNDVVQGIHREVRVMFQDSRLLPWEKVIDNVQLGAATKDKDTLITALRQVGLEQKADDWPSSLSGGQQQRVALARALAGNPGLLLLDEPLGALDALTRIEMQELIEQIWVQSKFTVLLVTHDVSEAVALADRVIVIEQGRIGLDIQIKLSRPRTRDSGFAYYEKLILDRLLDKSVDQPAGEYTI